MNKTININLGGVFFHIDEDAYQKLRKYLDAIRRSLSDDPKGKDEILTDIESRIGELLSERIKDVRQVVNQKDIEEIVEVMGRPEEYAGDTEIFNDEIPNSTKNKKTKKLFRDGRDKFLGGVSSGLAHYFGIDVIWIRLGWLILLIGGFSVILYPILWILLPEANTTSEKLEMEGEAVNISNIERKIKEEFTDVSQRLKDGIDDVSEQFKKGNYQDKVKSGLQEIIDLFARVFTVFFKVGGKFIGFFLVVISAASLIGILIGGFSLGSIEFLNLGDNFTNYPPFFHTSRIPLGLLITFLFVAVAIPFVLIFKLGLKIISSNVNPFSKATNLSLFGVWLLAIMGLAFAGIEYGAHSSKKFSVFQKHTIENNLLDTLNIKMIPKEDFKVRRYSDNKTVFVDGIEKAYKTNVSLDIRASNTDEMYLKVYKKAIAITKDKAKTFTDEIVYTFKNSNNDLLLDAYFLSEIKRRYQSQYVRMTLFIPKGKTIYLDKSTKYFLYDVDNIQDIRDKKMIKHYYKMTMEGLDCLDCKPKTTNKFESKPKEDRKRKVTVETTKPIIEKDSTKVKIEIE